VSEDTRAQRAQTGRRRHRAGEVRLLPPAYRPMTPEQEERALEAFAGLLAEADQRRARGAPRVRPAP
jgi:hypothetical protein